MSEPTDADRKVAEIVTLGGIVTTKYGEGNLRERIAVALATERAKAFIEGAKFASEAIEKVHALTQDAT